MTWLGTVVWRLALVFVIMLLQLGLVVLWAYRSGGILLDTLRQHFS